MTKIVRCNDGADERAILAAAAVHPELAAWLSDVWEKNLLASKISNIIGTQIVEFHRECGTAPGRHLEERCRQWAEGISDKATQELVDRLLQAVSDEAERVDTIVPSAVIQMAERHFKRVRLERLKNKLENELGSGRVDKAAEAVEKFAPLSSGGKTKFPMTSMEDINAGRFEPEQFLIDEVLVAGQPCILAGPEKSLKTCIAADLTVSLATGFPFLGEFDVVQPAKVWLMSGESGKATLSRNLRTMYRSRCGWGRCFAPRGEDGGWRSLRHVPKPYKLTPLVPMMYIKTDMAEVKSSIEREGIEVLIIDTASKSMKGDSASNLFLMQEQLDAVQSICRELNVTWILLHHFSGKQEYRTPVLSDTAYAGFKQHFRQWLLLNRREEYTPPSEANETRLHQLWMLAGGSAGHSSLWGVDVDEGTRRRPRWQVSVTNATDAKVETRVRAANKNVQDDVRIMLGKLEKSDAETLSSLCQALGGRKEKWRLAINAAMESGTIEQTELKRPNGQTYEAYKIKRG